MGANRENVKWAVYKAYHQSVGSIGHIQKLSDTS